MPHTIISSGLTIELVIDPNTAKAGTAPGGTRAGTIEVRVENATMIGATVLAKSHSSTDAAIAEGRLPTGLPNGVSTFVKPAVIQPMVSGILGGVLKKHVPSTEKLAAGDWHALSVGGVALSTEVHIIRSKIVVDVIHPSSGVIVQP